MLFRLHLSAVTVISTIIAGVEEKDFRALEAFLQGSCLMGIANTFLQLDIRSQQSQGVERQMDLKLGN